MLWFQTGFERNSDALIVPPAFALRASAGKPAEPSHQKGRGEWVRESTLNEFSSQLQTKRFFNLDGAVYEDGALSTKTKELLGLTAAMILRYNDCITYLGDR
jgi:alkylhydroperoxidase/carboxymuconolactone decarboxylase family protein YurZ